MIALIIFLLIVALVVNQLKKNVPNTATQKLFTIIRNAAFVGVFIAAIFSSIAQVGAGEAGVQVLFGSVQDGVLKSGLNFVNPLIDVEKMDVKTQAYTMSSIRDEGQQSGDDAISSLSMDGLTLKLDVTVWFRLSENDAPQVYRTIGMDYVEKIVRPAVRTAIRDVSVGYSATDIYSIKREDFVRDITKNLENAFNGRGIILERVLLEKC